ncbi:hypothetical protein EVAR_7591_1 [Eumeta japonica]|uniref:Regulatory protein zeste n=2 Tax=Eumeta variegata TaxID=151549 RepID=A0A4C1SL77_EUMVA|nr:hypothetical protein EVAR_7591_1 [Eumeta japonica]
MDFGKRSKNFTEREKSLLIEVAKEFVCIIDNKKTDGTSVEAKKRAWAALTNKYNAVSETGCRTEKQLHALYDNLKKKARKNMSDDKSEMYKTGGGTFCPKTTAIDEKIVALLTPQFKPLVNEFDSSAPYYNLDNITQKHGEDAEAGTSGLVVIEINDEVSGEPLELKSSKRPFSPDMLDAVSETPRKKKGCLTEIKKKNINSLSASIIKRKKEKQSNEDCITKKKLEILELQKQQEVLKLEKTKIILELDIELKRVLLESAQLDLEFKRKTLNL